MNEELVDFAELVRSLEEREFGASSRCQGWTAGDVAAHLIGAFADITSGRVEGQGTPEVSERQVAERRGRTASELADELADVAKAVDQMLSSFDDVSWSSQVGGGYDMTLGQAMEAFWMGTYIHADDIRTAIGEASVRGPGLRASVYHIADLLSYRDWGPAVLALDGLEEIVVEVGKSTKPEAPRITGDPLAFVLAATGRADPEAIGLEVSVNVFA